jgi:hypothetical protein
VDIFRKLKELNFPLGEYVVVGSGPLAARGLREANDLDIAVSPKLLAELVASGHYEQEMRHGKLFLKAPDIDVISRLDWEAYPTTVEQAIKTAELIKGYPFLNAAETIKFKRALGREKDFRDIALLEGSRPARRRALVIGLSILFAVLAVGVAIPKLTVHDLVPVEPSLKDCVSLGVGAHYDNPLDRLALLLGRSQIVSATRSSAEVENFTLFRIPLGALHGDYGLREGIFCDMIGDGNVPQTSDNATSTAMSVEDEHSGPVEYCTSATRPCEVNPKGLNVVVHVPQGLTLRVENQASWDTGLFKHLTMHDSTNGPNTIDSYATSPDFALGVGEGFSPYSGPALDLSKPLEKLLARFPYPNIRSPRIVEMDGQKGLLFYWLGDIYGGGRTFEAMLIIPNPGHEYSNIIFPIGLEMMPSETATFDVGDMGKLIATHQEELSRKLEEIDRDFDITSVKQYSPLLPDSGRPVFLSAIPAGRFDDLKLDDLPSTMLSGQDLPIAVANNHLFRPTPRHLLEYDHSGRLVRYSDPAVFACSDGYAPRITGVGRTLYAGCLDDAVYEIDLEANRVVARYGYEAGLTNVQNFDLVSDGGVLWIGTMEGIFRLDRATREVTKATTTQLPPSDVSMSFFGYGEKWRVKLDDGPTDVFLADRAYLAMSARQDDRYFLTSGAGLEQYVRGQSFPELLVSASTSAVAGQVVLSDSGRYVLGLADMISDEGGEWYGTDYAVYDRQAGRGFAFRVEGDRISQSPNFDGNRNPRPMALTERAGRLYLTRDGRGVYRVDWDRRRLAAVN